MFQRLRRGLTDGSVDEDGPLCDPGAGASGVGSALGAKSPAVGSHTQALDAMLALQVLSKNDLYVVNPAVVRAAQGVFDETGGLHVAVLFTPDGTLDAVAGDVGRHNAVNK